MHYFNNCSNGLIVTSNGLKHLKHNAVSTGVKIDRGVYLSRINQMPDSQDSRVWSIPVGVVRQVHTVPCKLMPNGGNATSVQKCRHYPSRVVRIAVKSNYELIILCHEFCTGEREYVCARLRYANLRFSGILSSRLEKGTAKIDRSFDEKEETVSALSLFFFPFSIAERFVALS